MSHIPNSAMPHAGDLAEHESEEKSSGTTLKERAGKLADKARANPKTAAAAGAAIIAGVAAAAIPLVRGRNGGGKADGSKGKKKN